MTLKRSALIVLLFCVAATAVGVYWLGGLAPEQVQAWLARAGFWAPLVYVLLYTLGTLLLLPSTPLNLSGGAIFGVWWGTLWTAIAAIVAAVAAFAFTRTIGHDWAKRQFRDRWQILDHELSQGGLYYMTAIRLLPLIPYGLVNFAAGLTSIRGRDYVVGTLLGTVPGILPFVMMGAGLQALRQGNVLPVSVGLGLTGLLVGGATWYRRHRSTP
ncbi:MAG: TVP38/TMEM64 family protein [Spirulinaceae cyanobacterium RM2_2_10]|nr:TVP38/TMEM64 family protein [Spirulinaceae cyanobacterium SM2_1_0]NJO21452.1 TVP38/TMEM64 family protein [Spirulinaceae cyanobacterium RM2_2_10]